MKREDARTFINEQPITNFINLTPSKGSNNYNCPICGSGTGKNHTGALHIYPDNRIVCFSNNCFTEKGQDTLGALRIIWNCDETTAMLRSGCPINENNNTSFYKPKLKEEPKKEIIDYSFSFDKWHTNLINNDAALAYMQKRGISEAVINRFNIGYCESWNHPKTPQYKSNRIIIPRGKSAYTARDILNNGNYCKQKVGANKIMLNYEALEINDLNCVFICEGEFDAFSFIEVNAEAVSIGSISNINTMLNAALDHPEKVYIIALDNDIKEDGRTPGQDAQSKLYLEMQKNNIMVISANVASLYCSFKDANEALINNRNQFALNVSKYIKEAAELKRTKQEEREIKKQTTGEAMLDAFLSEIKTNRYEAIPTGINRIDKVLEGGFMRKTLITLGAAPGMGKTAIAQYIFENMAKAGKDVLYLNLEMDRTQLLARSVSRIAWDATGKKPGSAGDISPIEIMRGFNWDAERESIVNYAIGLYKKNIAKHFSYNPKGTNNKLSSILEVIKEEANEKKIEGREAPIICLDYLQLIENDLTENKDNVEGLKAALTSLKDIAITYNTVVFIIIAHGRASNKAGTVTMESGRDTSAIEYTGDIMLGLNYSFIEDHKKDAAGKEYTLDLIREEIDKAEIEGKPTPESAKNVCLKILKSRFTESHKKARFIFDGKHNTFEETYYK